jgi:hypothetical protein
VQFYWHKTLGNVINGNLTQDAIIDLQPGSGHGRNSPAGHPSEFGSELSFGRLIGICFSAPDHQSTRGEWLIEGGRSPSWAMAQLGLLPPLPVFGDVV